MKKLLITGSVLICIIFCRANAQTTLVLQPDNVTGKDALLHGLSSEVNVNYGSNPQLAANAWTFGGTPGVVRGVLQFDLSSIPTGAIISGASLSLYAYDKTDGFGFHSTLSGSNACWLRRIVSSWNEHTITWSNQPTTTTLNQVSLPASISPTQNYLNVDVTAMVQDMIDNPSTSFGFMLCLQNESYYRRMNFASSDHTIDSLRPKLVVTYNNTTVTDTCFTLQPDFESGKDALLHGLSSEVNVNYGSNPQLAANAWTFGGASGVVRGALQFDFSFIPAGAVISNASLSLYAYDKTDGFGFHSALSGSNACWLRRIVSSWNEHTITWSNQPTTTTLNQVSLPASISPTQNYLNVDVTAMVQDMIDNPSTGFGFMLSLQNESYYRRMNFASSDHTIDSLRPKIKICYSLPNGFSEMSKTGKIDFNAYPNPVSNRVDININNFNGKGALLEIINCYGQIVSRAQIYDHNTIIYVSGYSKGIYLLKVTMDNVTSVQKLLVE